MNVHVVVEKTAMYNVCKQWRDDAIDNISGSRLRYHVLERQLVALSGRRTTAKQH